MANALHSDPSFSSILPQRNYFLIISWFVVEGTSHAQGFKRTESSKISRMPLLAGEGGVGVVEWSIRIDLDVLSDTQHAMIGHFLLRIVLISYFHKLVFLFFLIFMY